MAVLTRKDFLRGVAAIAAFGGLGIHAAHADQLADIMAAKKIRVALDNAYPPYGMLDTQMKLTGSDVEVSEAMAKDWGVNLEFVQVTGATRIPTLQSGRADIVIANLSVTAERAQVIDFTRPYSTIRAVVGAKTNLDIKSMEDLKGRVVSVTRSAVPDRNMTAAAEKFGFTVQRFEDDATTITAAVTGQADIVASSDAVITEISRRNSNFKPKFEQASYNLAIGVQKGQPALLAKLNGWLTENFANGKLSAIYKKYHGADLPDHIVNFKTNG